MIRRDDGFTLIEILVVVLIISILAAIAIPSFLSQRGKSQDACAKTQLRTALSAAIAMRTDLPTTAMTLTTLNRQERTVPTAATGGCPGTTTFGVFANSAANANCNGGSSTTEAMCLRITSPSSVRYSIVRDAAGTITRNCYVPAGANRGGCPAGNTW